MASSTDRIEKKTLLRASQARVWNALSNSAEFGSWFGMKIDGPFKPGSALKGKISMKGQDMTLNIMVEQVQPEEFFSFRWQPYALDPKTDYSAEPTTLIEFHLAKAEGGTALTIVESGFDSIPAGVRIESFARNEKGWTSQMENIRKYVEG